MAGTLFIERGCPVPVVPVVSIRNTRWPLCAAVVLIFSLISYPNPPSCSENPVSFNIILLHSFVQSDRWFYIDDGPLFETLPHVIDHYSRCADGLPVLLKMALPPDGNPPVVVQNIPAPPTRKRPPLTPALSTPVLNTPSARVLPGRNPLQRAGSAVSTLHRLRV